MGAEGDGAARMPWPKRIEQEGRPSVEWCGAAKQQGKQGEMMSNLTNSHTSRYSYYRRQLHRTCMEIQSVAAHDENEGRAKMSRVTYMEDVLTSCGYARARIRHLIGFGRTTVFRPCDAHCSSQRALRPNPQRDEGPRVCSAFALHSPSSVQSCFPRLCLRSSFGLQCPEAARMHRKEGSPQSW